MRLGHDAAGLADFQRAAALDPGCFEAQRSLSMALSEAGRGAEALAAAERALRLQPDHPRAWFARGRAHLVLQEGPEAERAFGRSLELEPGLVEARVNRGLVRSSLGHYDAALADIDQVIAANPKDDQAYGARALVLFRRKLKADLVSAEAAIDQALTLKPRSAQHLVLRAWIRGSRGNIAGARGDAAAALRLDPQGPYGADALRVLKLLRGRPPR
jgi:tetratricopeptide (TPR) repeat protein